MDSSPRRTMSSMATAHEVFCNDDERTRILLRGWVRVGLGGALFLGFIAFQMLVAEHSLMWAIASAPALLLATWLALTGGAHFESGGRGPRRANAANLG